MSDTLVLRLAGPLQSWGTTSRFTERRTDPLPSKSGVLGMVAGAQGRAREDTIEDLLTLRMGVRVEQQGRVLRDYHTISLYTGGTLPTAKGTLTGGTNKVSNRYYLEDAVFLVALEGESPLVAEVEQALLHPKIALGLGRRSCPPAGRMVRGTRPGSVESVLGSEPWAPGQEGRRRAGVAPSVRVGYEIDDPAGTVTRCDVPVNWSPRVRQYGWRRVRAGYIDLPVLPNEVQNHDPLELLEGTDVSH